MDLSQSQDPWGPKVGVAGPVGVPEWGRPGLLVVATGCRSGSVARAVRRSSLVFYRLSALRSPAGYHGLSWVCVSRFRVGSGRARARRRPGYPGPVPDAGCRAGRFSVSPPRKPSKNHTTNPRDQKKIEKKNYKKK